MISTNELPAEVQAVIDAWVVPGPVWSYHEQWKRKVRRGWPTLANALDALSKAGTR